MSGFWYLASPYSHYAGGIEAAHRGAVNAAIICIKAGIPVFSPIAHCHFIAVHGGIDGGFKTWRAFDEAMIVAALGVIVVGMDGWCCSHGIAAEVELCARLGKPVLYMPEGGPAPNLKAAAK